MVAALLICIGIFYFALPSLVENVRFKLQISNKYKTMGSLLLDMYCAFKVKPLAEFR